MTKRILATVIAMLLFSPAAMAQQQGTEPATQQKIELAQQEEIATAQQGTKGACVGDIKEKCAATQPGQGRIGVCIKQQLTEFSQPCQARLAKLAEAKKVCEADVKKDCAGMKLRLRRIACIKKSLSNLSEPCKAELSKAVAGRS